MKKIVMIAAVLLALLVGIRQADAGCRAGRAHMVRSCGASRVVVIRTRFIQRTCSPQIIYLIPACQSHQSGAPAKSVQKK